MQDEEIEFLKCIKKNFLCQASFKNVCWKLFVNNIDLQAELISNTTRLQLVLKFPVSQNYQKIFLKQLIEFLEKQGSAIHDSLYEEYGRLVAVPEQNVYFKHYQIEKTAQNITLKEDIHLISEGTTGLRTWQASLALSEWVLLNTSHFKSKIVLELGTGIGLTGLVISLLSSVKSFYFTDCHPSVLSVLCDNIKLNIHSGADENSVKDFCLYENVANSSVVRVYNLPWEDVSLKICDQLGQIDIIVAADVVYDKSIFHSLISAVDCFFSYCGVREFILSCTERNSETLAEFLSLVRQKYTVTCIEIPAQENFLWETAPAVKIFSITKLIE